MADATYQPKVYRKHGGDELVVADGGKITIESGGIINGYVFRGTLWFADSSVSASGDGLSWTAAFKTITEAVAAASAGDTIVMRGSFTESVTISTASLTLLGLGTSPRDACYWNPVAGNDKVNLTISAAYTRVENIYFRPGAQSSTYSACIVIGTTAAHTRIERCRFQGTTGAYYAIYSPATGADNVHVNSCQFVYFNTATNGSAIRTAQASPWNAYSAWQITNCEFNSCVSAIIIQARVCRIIGNTIAEYGVAAAGTVGAVLAKGISLTGNGAECGGNVVFFNQFGGTYNATLYTAATGDQWGGNFNALTGGVTAVNPA
jgi:hypothetical protein